MVGNINVKGVDPDYVPCAGLVRFADPDCAVIVTRNPWIDSAIITRSTDDHSELFTQGRYGPNMFWHQLLSCRPVQPLVEPDISQPLCDNRPLIGWRDLDDTMNRNAFLPALGRRQHLAHNQPAHRVRDKRNRLDAVKVFNQAR